MTFIFFAIYYRFDNFRLQKPLVHLILLGPQTPDPWGPPPKGILLVASFAPQKLTPMRSWALGRAVIAFSCSEAVEALKERLRELGFVEGNPFSGDKAFSCTTEPKESDKVLVVGAGASSLSNVERSTCFLSKAGLFPWAGKSFLKKFDQIGVLGLPALVRFYGRACCEGSCHDYPLLGFVACAAYDPRAELHEELGINWEGGGWRAYVFLCPLCDAKDDLTLKLGPRAFMLGQIQAFQFKELGEVLGLPTVNSEGWE